MNVWDMEWLYLPSLKKRSTEVCWMACESRGVMLRRVWHRVSSWSRDVFYGGCQEKICCLGVREG